MGAIKDLPALVWPASLKRPVPGPGIVYLDQNHWISLAQAATGHGAGRPFVETLDACRRARGCGKALFVLSSTHYFETGKIKDPAQRLALATVMEELTGLNTIVSRTVIMELELIAMLDYLTGMSTMPTTVPLIGRGVLHAFGLAGSVRIMGPLGDETASVRDGFGAERFDNYLARAYQNLERSVLRGPSDDELPELKRNGWDFEAIVRTAEARATDEAEQSRRLDEESRWRRGRLIDIVCARELLIEFKDTFPRCLDERGLTSDRVMTSPEAARAFLRGMPSSEVAVQLKVAWHRDGAKRWTVNDIQDIDAMSIAVPYCDVVVTDKACHNALTAARLDERMSTKVLRRLEELPAVIGT